MIEGCVDEADQQGWPMRLWVRYSDSPVNKRRVWKHREATPEEYRKAARPHADLEAAAKRILKEYPSLPKREREVVVFARAVLDAALGADDE